MHKMKLAIKIALWVPYIFSQVTLAAGVIVINLAYDISQKEMALLIGFIISYSAMAGASIELRHWFKGERLEPLVTWVTHKMKNAYTNLKTTWKQKLMVAIVISSVLSIIAMSWYGIIYVWTNHVIA